MDEDDYDEDFDPWVFIGGLPPLSRCAPKHRPERAPEDVPVHKNKNTLVLDLDETLVHSNLEQTLSFPADFSFPVNFNNQEHIVNVRRRPYLTEFMESPRGTSRWLCSPPPRLRGVRGEAAERDRPGRGADPAQAVQGRVLARGGELHEGPQRAGEGHEPDDHRG